LVARIALVADVPNWAFHRIAKAIQFYSPEDLIFDIYFAHQTNLSTLHKYLDSRYDLIHYYWRLIPLHVRKGDAKITTAIYDHQYLDDHKLNSQIFKVIDGVYASSAILKKQYDERYPELLGKVFDYCPDGVQRELFDSMREYEISKLRPLELIWVGNSKWGVDDHKGFNTVFVPLVNKIKKSIYSEKIKINVIDSSIKKRTFAEMSSAYEKADILLCTSKNEGTPNPILEASASGLTWISTPVGIVPEIAGPIQETFIVNRDPDSFFEKVVHILENPEILEMAGRENYKNILDWGWDLKAQAHFEFFRRTLST
jgi:glycosyltransferase involved in cell wall biosynthesis